MSRQHEFTSVNDSTRSNARRSLLVLSGVVLFHSAAAAQTTTRVSVSSSGAQGTWLSFDAAISGNGRYVAFQSSATNLVAGDTNSSPDIFVRDLVLGTTERVSVSSSGTQTNSGSIEPAISPDGRFVAFLSAASTLVAGDTNDSNDIFVRDRQLGTTECVSRSTAGTLGNASSYTPSISDDGRYVAFWSYASNLIAGDTNDATDVFVRDRQSGSLVCASVSSSGVLGNQVSESPAISGNGRFVAFHSRASNFAGDPNGIFYDVFVRDLVLGTTECVSATTSTSLASYYAAISFDGRFVAFESTVADLVPGDTNFGTDVFVRDRLLGSIERVNLTTSGGQAASGGDTASISPDGRYVAFASWTADLVSGDTNNWKDIFVRDRVASTTERVSLTHTGGEPNNQSAEATISADGRFVVFASTATNFVPGDTNNSVDVFLRDRTGGTATLSFCFGDGSGTACPCGAGTAGNGCPSSVNANGANLAGSGTASIASDSFVLSGTGMTNSTALYFQGTAQVNGGLGTVFGDGLRCAGGTILRLGVETNVAGASQYPAGADLPVSVRGLNSAGNVRTYQVWYRNSAAFCAPTLFNLTNGVQITWAT